MKIFLWTFIYLFLIIPVLLLNWKMFLFIMSILIVFHIIVKNDLKKIQIERADFNNQEVLDTIEKDLRKKK